MQLTVLPDRVAICQLPPQVAPPPWVWSGAFCSITRTAHELSIVTEEANVPAGITSDPGWRVLVVAGPLNLNMTGVLLALAEPLAGAGVSIFSISTYDTDHILVREEKLPDALAALQMAGNTIV